MWRRSTAILLVLWFAALGTGLLEYLHDLQHEAEDAAIAAVAPESSGNPQTNPPHPIHDETNCPIHAQLHMPLLTSGWVPLLVCLGLFVAFLTLLRTPLVSRRSPARIDCRGPPRAASLQFVLA